MPPVMAVAETDVEAMEVMEAMYINMSKYENM